MRAAINPATAERARIVSTAVVVLGAMIRDICKADAAYILVHQLQVIAYPSFDE
jgi:hypothetical protein